MEPLTVLPVEIQNLWQAGLTSAPAGPAYRLVSIEPAKGGHQDRRITVEVTDINGLPVAVPVAFSYSTASKFSVTPDFTWSPPAPRRAHIVATNLGGVAEEIQGGPVKDGEPGGVTVYVLDPRFPSDVVTGLGMLADHTGLRLRFELQVPGALSFEERLAATEERLAAIDAQVKDIWTYIGPVTK